MPRRLAAVYPGEVLLEEFLEPMGISQYRPAKDIDVPPRRINEIVHHSRAVSADTALRLARDFGTSKRFWLNLQSQYNRDTEDDFGRWYECGTDDLATGQRMRLHLEIGRQWLQVAGVSPGSAAGR